MADLAEQPFIPGRDLRPVLALVAGARASHDPHAFLHPGGLQWLLRRLANATFTVRLWRDGAALAGAIVDDAGYVMVVSADPSLERYLWLLDRAEAARRDRGDAAMTNPFVSRAPQPNHAMRSSTVSAMARPSAT